MHTDQLSRPVRKLPVPRVCSGRRATHIQLKDAAEPSSSAIGQHVRRVDGGARQFRELTDEDRARIMQLPLDHIGNDEFARLPARKRETEILGPLPESDLPAGRLRAPEDLPAYLARLYDMPLLTREQEVHLFRKMNYLKHKASALRTLAAGRRTNRRWMDRIDRLHAESVTIKNLIVTANLRLVVSIAKKYVGQVGDFFELVSDGNVSLIRAVERFDYARGNRFSTYASWAIMNNFARAIPHALRYRSRFCTSFPDVFSTMVDIRSDQHEREAALTRRESYVQRLLDRLNERERQIITSRFGLDRGQPPLKLKQIGAALGVTKERIRQLQNRALATLRQAAEADRIDDLLS
ncbi:MAG: sigma-70 family RNA polymerase sigma factor [Pirellulaceae bacterium]|jgi:RNA polymerase primary sigma factor/RNA polymerase sigma factor|nr:sigma-70 family RNA polymerase sigma factor [Pirellulaceae bacterium]